MMLTRLLTDLSWVDTINGFMCGVLVTLIAVGLALSFFDNRYGPNSGGDKDGGG